MPLLGGLMVGLFTSLAEFFLLFFTQSAALRLAFAALVVLAFSTLYVVITGLISGIVYTMPAGLVSAFAFVFPENISACISAALGCDAACMGAAIYIYELGMK